MEHKKIKPEQANTGSERRPQMRDDFIGQKDIKQILQTAIMSAKQRNDSIGHMLFSGSSGFGKTTLAGIVSRQLGTSIKIITGYALLKPADLISVLNNLGPLDVLFIDEIHRLKPQLEEILYTAMEDGVIDMILPDGSSMRLPLQPFTLIGATTKPEKLSAPLKNRFVYKFHLIDYTFEEKIQIIERYLKHYGITYDKEALEKVGTKVLNVPREIFNTVTKVRDFIVGHQLGQHLDLKIRQQISSWIDIDEGGITPFQKSYLELLRDADFPLGVSTIAARMGVEEDYIENDIEPLLMKLGHIVKTPKGRVYVG